MVGQALDKIIGFFSPQSELKRLAARELIHKVRNQYAAAKAGVQGGAWNPVDAKINTVIANSIHSLRARARQLVRDMPAMATAIDRVEQFTVGDGITLQARVKDPSTGRLAKGINTKIEDAWKYWCDEADAGGRLHFHEIQQLACRQDVEVGEFVIIKIPQWESWRKGGRYLPFSLLVLEPDQLTGYGATPIPGNEIYQGVEYDPQTGQAIAYHFDDPNRWSKPLRITADKAILGFRTLRPGQLRGVTPLAPTILLAHQLRDYLEAEIATAQKAARWLAFVTSEDPAATMRALGSFATPLQDGSEGQRYAIEMGHSVIDFLRTGEKVEIADHNRPGEAFEPFVKFILRSFAAAVGVSYELISGDYYDAKYTAARVSRNDMLKGIKVRRGRMIRQLCEPVKREFMDWAVYTQKLDLPGYFADRSPWMRSVWMEPGMEHLDPLKEGRAESDAVTAKLRSPQEVLQARGRDPEQVLDEWAEWREMLDERGLTLPEDAESPLKTNPAAVAGNGNGSE